jgi:DNA-binding beta-propeller fold protein YncE
VNLLIVFIPRIEMSSFGIKLYTINHNTNQQLTDATTPNSPPPSNFKTATKYEFVKKCGSKETGEGQFTVPYNVDVDSNGDVWVADRGNHRIQKFDKDGNFLFKFDSFGSKEGQFNNPRQIAVDKDIKYLYVVDSKNNRIQKFDTKLTVTEKV